MRESKSRALPLGYTPTEIINGVNSGTRTHDFQSHNLALYQLNYIHHIVMVHQKGFEPLTLALEGRCSIQLSYWCIISHFVKWSGWRESDPRDQLGRLGLYHWATPALPRFFTKRINIISLLIVVVNNFFQNFN